MSHLETWELEEHRAAIRTVIGRIEETLGCEGALLERAAGGGARPGPSEPLNGRCGAAPDPGRDAATELLTEALVKLRETLAVLDRMGAEAAPAGPGTLPGQEPSWPATISSRIEMLGAAAPRRVHPADDLTRIVGIDSELAQRLAAQGVHTFADMAAWRAADVARLAKELGLGRRISSENWIEQAALLVIRAGEAGPQDDAARDHAKDPEASSARAGEGESEPAEAVADNAPFGASTARPPEPNVSGYHSLIAELAALPGSVPSLDAAAATEPAEADDEPCAAEEEEVAEAIAARAPASEPQKPPVPVAPPDAAVPHETLEQRLNRIYRQSEELLDADEENVTALARQANGTPPAFAPADDVGLARFLERRRASKNRLSRFGRAGPAFHRAEPPAAGEADVTIEPRAPARMATTGEPRHAERSPGPGSPVKIRTAPLSDLPLRTASVPAAFNEWAEEASVEIVRDGIPLQDRLARVSRAAGTGARPIIGRFLKALRGD